MKEKMPSGLLNPKDYDAFMDYIRAFSLRANSATIAIRG